MSLINKIIFKIYDGQLKNVEEKQKELSWDEEVQIEENIPYRNTKDSLDTYDYIYVKENKETSLTMIINIDGGTFAGGDKSCNKYYATSLAKSGYIATTLNYNYLPEVNLKKQV